MKTLYFILFLLISNSLYSQTLIGNTIVGSIKNDGTGSAVAISKDGKIIAVGSQKIKNAQGKDLGETRIYSQVNGVWTQLGNTISGVEPYTNSGGRLDIDDEGKRIVLGALFNNNGGSGVVRVFEWKNNQWIQIGSGLGTGTFNNVGWNVKISGNGKRVVFSTDEIKSITEISGNVQIYEWNVNSWKKVGNTLDTPSTYDGFGLGLAINYEGDQVIVGAPYGGIPGGVNVGEATVYTLVNGQWNQKGQTLKGTDLGGFGVDVDMTGIGSRIIVGSTQNFNNKLFVGAVRVYDYAGTQWKQLGDTIFGTDAFQRMGQDVEISADGNIISIGSSFVNDGAGQTQPYKLVNGNWNKIGNPINGLAPSDRLGTDSKLSSDGKTIILGAAFNNADKPGYAQVWAIDQDDDNDGFNSAVDCNDNDPTINPNAPEICDDIDNNCNGMADDGLQLFTYFVDSDGDGFGVIVNSITTCNTSVPSGYTSSSNDCDDNNLSIYPGAQEIPNNSIDEDCNGQDFTTSTSDPKPNKIIISPNPASSIIEIQNFNKGDFELSIFTTSGNSIINLFNPHSIDVSTFESGIYIFRFIHHSDLRPIYQRVIIQH